MVLWLFSLQAVGSYSCNWFLFKFSLSVYLPLCVCVRAHCSLFWLLPPRIYLYVLSAASSPAPILPLGPLPPLIELPCLTLFAHPSSCPASSLSPPCLLHAAAGPLNCLFTASGASKFLERRVSTGTMWPTADSHAELSLHHGPSAKVLSMHVLFKVLSAGASSVSSVSSFLAARFKLRSRTYIRTNEVEF